jgi:hypothetical protein
VTGGLGAVSAALAGFISKTFVVAPDIRSQVLNVMEAQVLEKSGPARTCPVDHVAVR